MMDKHIPKVMLVDANALGHVVKHATKELSWNGDKTGVIYGFIQKMIRIQSEVNADQIIFCWDVNRDDLFRKSIFPDYKKKPEKEQTKLEKDLEEIARPQFLLLRKEVLPEIGFMNNIIEKGLEADDILAQLTLQLKSDNEVIIVTRDNDLHQMLVSGRVLMFDPIKMGYFSESIFHNKWGIGPEDWAYVKAIAGCAGDGVPGVPGVKEKTAIKFLKGELKATTKAYKAIVAAEEKCVFNIRLVKLPFETTPHFNIQQDELSTTGFINVCKKYGFNSLLEGAKFRDFEELFIR
jgi:5'-3' exonuclease